MTRASLTRRPLVALAAGVLAASLAAATGSRAQDSPKASRSEDSPKASRSEDAPKASRSEDAPKASHSEDAPTASPAPGHGNATQGPQLQFEPFQDDAFIAAKKSGTPVVLYFEADWCAPCKEMHERTFRSPDVLAAAAGMRLFRVDMTNPDPYHALLQKSFQVLGEPTLIVFGTDGAAHSRRFGFVPPEVLTKMLTESRTPKAAQ